MTLERRIGISTSYLDEKLDSAKALLDRIEENGGADMHDLLALEFCGEAIRDEAAKWNEALGNTPHEMKTLEGVMTSWGNTPHARVKGETATLCGLKPFVGANTRRTVYRTQIDVVPDLVTCKRCRRHMGLEGG